MSTIRDGHSRSTTVAAMVVAIIAPVRSATFVIRYVRRLTPASRRLRLLAFGAAALMAACDDDGVAHPIPVDSSVDAATGVNDGVNDGGLDGAGDTAVADATASDAAAVNDSDTVNDAGGLDR